MNGELRLTILCCEGGASDMIGMGGGRASESISRGITRGGFGLNGLDGFDADM